MPAVGALGMGDVVFTLCCWQGWGSSHVPARADPQPPLGSCRYSLGGLGSGAPLLQRYH